MKTATQIYDAKTQAFINKQMSDEMYILELICITIVTVVAIKYVCRVLIALFSRSVYIHTPNFKKVIVSGQHLLPSKRN